MTRSGTTAGLTSAVLLVLGTAATSAAQSPMAVLDRTTVPASGVHSAVVDVHRYGRYSLRVASEQGVTLQLVDRMTGPGQVMGSPGEHDGRLDLILDRSRYKIVTRGHDDATGEAALAVHPFTELHPDPIPELIELKLVQTRLGDLEQLSYWLRLPTERWVVLEAAGRNLRDLRLWRDGTWLVDAEPVSDVIDPVAGQPLLACRLAVRLEAGTYLLTAYGGEGQPWSAGSDQRPLALRWGIPSLAMAGRARREMSPFGTDRWLVPRQANLYRLELPEARPASLSVTPYSEASAFSAPHRTSAIDKDTREPVAEILTHSTDHGLNLVTVTAEAGSPYALQHFDHRRSYSFSSGTYWVSTVHTGHPTDSVDATAILVENDRQKANEPVAAQVVDLDLDRGWRRTCNLLDELTIFVRVHTPGSYHVGLGGVEARYRFEPFLITRPSDYREPRLRGSDTTWELDAGYFVLTVMPEERGIVTVTLRHADGDEPSEAPLRSTVRLGQIRLDQSSWGYTLFLNRRPGVKEGLVLRPGQLDLHQALPIVLGPGEELELPTVAHPPGVLVAFAEDGAPLGIAEDGDGWTEHLVTTQRRGVTRVHNPRDEAVWASVGYRRAQLLDTTPLPVMPSSALPTLPDFPVLRQGRPLYFDLNRHASRTFAVEAEEAGLYRLETTGLLDTAGVLRSRTVTELARGSDGGSGRNVLLHRYLRRGDYQMTITAQGDSAGRAGIVLTRSEAADGGRLGHGTPARTELGAGDTVQYRFSIAEDGEHRLRSMALGRTVRCRLEDAAGWPIARPGLVADLSRRFDPGDYRLVLLPEPVEGRRVTLIEPVPEPLAFTGRGPHPLPLEVPVDHLWLEPENGQADPDRWSFELPAATRVVVRLSGEMEGELLDHTGSQVAEVPAGRGFEGPLEAGGYQLAVASSRHDNRVPYTVQVEPEALLAGLRRTVIAPAVLQVAVAGGGLTELASFGADDVRAVLVETDGSLVAHSDDRFGDWGFHIAERLEAGDYTLEVEPVGAATARAEILHEHRVEAVQSALTPPARLVADTAGAVLMWPLELAADAELLLVSTRADGELGVAVDGRADNGSWRTLAARAGGSCRLVVALSGGDTRLRVWSDDGRGSEASVQVAVARPQRLDESGLTRGVRLEPVEGIEPRVGVAAIEIDRPGTFRLASGVLAASAPGQDLIEPARGLVAAPGGWLWLASLGRAAARGERVSLAPGGVPLQLTVEQPTLIDVGARGRGPLLVEAESVVDQPLVSLVTHTDATGPSLRHTTTFPGGAVSVALAPAEPALAVWAGGERAVDVRVRAVRLSEPAVGDATTGTSELLLEPAASHTLRLPHDVNRLRITLDAGLVAALADGDTIHATVSGGGHRHVETMVTEAPQLVLLNPTERSARASLELAAALADGPDLAIGSSVEAIMPEAGTWRLRLAASEAATLRVAGAARSATVLGDDGSFTHGAENDLAAGQATVLLEHDAGLVVAWLDTDEPMAGLWSGPAAATPETVELPLNRTLDGDRLELAFGLEELRLVTLRSTASAVMRLDTGTATEVWLDTGGGLHHVVVAPGAARVGVRGLGGAPLTGGLHIDSSTPVTLGEGLGPEVLLAPGAARLFRFTLPAAGRVGVGVRSDTDAAECTLVSSVGATLGHGVVQLHELEAGEYLLIVLLNADAEPTRARPAVVGLDRPGTGPPEAVIRTYLDEGVHP